jgi:hypothetical protein
VRMLMIMLITELTDGRHRWVSRWCGQFFQYQPNNLKPQSQCSPIRYTMYLLCVLAFWTGCRPDTHGHRAVTGNLRLHRE